MKIVIMRIGLAEGKLLQKIVICASIAVPMKTVCFVSESSNPRIVWICIFLPEMNIVISA